MIRKLCLDLSFESFNDNIAERPAVTCKMLQPALVSSVWDHGQFRRNFIRIPLALVIVCVGPSPLDEFTELGQFAVGSCRIRVR